MMPKTLGGWIIVWVFVCSIITILKITGLGMFLLGLIDDPGSAVPEVDIKR